MAVRPEFGPSLPGLLAARGVSRRGIVAGAVALVVLLVGGWLLVQALRDREHLIVAGPPVFNLVYSPSALSEAPPRGDELVRLRGRRRNISISISARRVEVPPYEREDVVNGFLPLLAEGRLAELREQYGRVQVYDEGKARINRFPGYQIGFGASPGEQRLFGRDTYLFPDDPGATEGVLLSMRRVIRGRQRPRDVALFDAARATLASFAFGPEQP